MLFGILSAALAAQPVILFVRNLPENGAPAGSGVAWSQALAAELRRYGLRVTTESDLQALLAGTKQQQIMGCNDADCGLDLDVINVADGTVKVDVSYGDDVILTGAITRAKVTNVFKINYGSTVQVTTSKRGVIDALKEEMAPQLVANLRLDYPDRISEKPAAEAKTAQGTVVPRKCSASGGEALALLAALTASASSRSSARARCRPRSSG